MDNRIMDLTTADNIIQEIASKGVTQINRLILFGGEPFLNIELFIYFIEKLSTLLNFFPSPLEYPFHPPSAIF